MRCCEVVVVQKMNVGRCCKMLLCFLLCAFNVEILIAIFLKLEKTSGNTELSNFVYDCPRELFGKFEMTGIECKRDSDCSYGAKCDILAGYFSLLLLVCCI